MKTTFISLITGLILLATSTEISAQRRVTVEAVNDDISYYLDLKAVSYLFGESKDLEDFEYRLNDPENNFSNLDLNSDGYIDYLRVIEATEKNVHLVVIQAVLDRDVYQDVATIVVDRDRYKRTYVQVIGDPFIYGPNYIIEPYFYHTPSIFSWFWRPRYNPWYSPYYWGYYPRYYTYRRPIEINIYLSNINKRIYKNTNYRYTENRRYSDYDRLHSSVRRNDFETRNPQKNFSSRNNSARNKSTIESQGRATNRNSDNSLRNSSQNENNRMNSGSRTIDRNTSNSTNNRSVTRSSGSNNTNSSRSVTRSTGTSNSGIRSSGSEPQRSTRQIEQRNQSTSRPVTIERNNVERKIESRSTGTTSNKSNVEVKKPESRSNRVTTQQPASTRQETKPSRTKNIENKNDNRR